MWHTAVCLFLPEEPEEEVSFEDLEARAKAGDAKAQTKVSVDDGLQWPYGGHRADQPSHYKCSFRVTLMGRAGH